ncbi:MAG: organoarsenical effux MFS transporter ArsJ [Gammaproteobacteria bacterium]|nr:organoarsenical effux MFS transporter ArsJ [Gammaproteobacteria bacterium]NVK89175.1 organoarsenical effux MFS transporter ArsJ [Gammaproteobacteria bacterium]
MKPLAENVRQYLNITINYWAFTLSDGALRMLVVLYFYQLGYSPLAVASLFLFYEIFGVVTNLIGGWLGARIGLNRTMNAGLFLQIVALSMLLVPVDWLSVVWVMIAQALSGIAKDLNKMSAKTAIKTLVPKQQTGRLFRWVALLTGSKNALKGLGFFLGGALLSGVGFWFAILTLTLMIGCIWMLSLFTLRHDLAKLNRKPKFSEIFSTSSAINRLAAARCFLFAARDVWFVIALPLFLATSLQWDHWQVGSFLAAWIIGYGAVQALAPIIAKQLFPSASEVTQAFVWVLCLAFLMLLLALMMQFNYTAALIPGLILFAIIFALNSSVHSYLVVHFARDEGASMDVGFYYMSNAMGRLMGTVLSGSLYQSFGLTVCLWASLFMIVITLIITGLLPKQPLIVVNKSSPH